MVLCGTLYGGKMAIVFWVCHDIFHPYALSIFNITLEFNEKIQIGFEQKGDF